MKMMQNTIWIRAALAIALCAPAAAQSNGPSLAEVAQKNRDQQKHVITNDDFPSADSGGNAARQDNTQSASAPSLAADNKKDSAKAGSPQEKKPEDAAELKKKIDSYKQQRDVWKQSADSYEQKLAKESSQFRREVDERAMENDRHNAQVFQSKITQMESRLADMQKKSDDAKPPARQDSSTAGPHP